eukprot:8323779-Pyramimonas_sp.AAC.1
MSPRRSPASPETRIAKEFPRGIRESIALAFFRSLGIARALSRRVRKMIADAFARGLGNAIRSAAEQYAAMHMPALRKNAL